MSSIAMKTLKLVAASALALGLSTQAQAYVWNDNSVADWGVTATGSASDWTANLNAGVYYEVEDNKSQAAGGQSYDAEAMYIDFDNDYMYYAVVTGLSPTNNTWPAGDIALDFGSDGSYELGIEVLGDNGFDSGDLYSVTQWQDPIQFPSRDVVGMLAGTKLGDGDLSYSNTVISNNIGDDGGNHYLIEGRIALSNFSAYAGQSFTAHWTMLCGNDEIHLDPVNMPGGGNSVPTPGTLALLGLSLLGMSRVVRKSRRS